MQGDTYMKRFQWRDLLDPVIDFLIDVGLEVLLDVLDAVF